MKNSRQESESLWDAVDQYERLRELTAEEAGIKEVPLRRDVRSLGRLLGDVLKEQSGERLFKQVEELRLLTIQYREAADDKGSGQSSESANQLMQRVAREVASLDIAEAYRLTKAFAIYFELINLAGPPPRRYRPSLSIKGFS